MIRSERYGFFIIFQENRQVGRERFLFYLPQGEGHSADLLLITLRIYIKKKIPRKPGFDSAAAQQATFSEGSN